MAEPETTPETSAEIAPNRESEKDPEKKDDTADDKDKDAEELPKEEAAKAPAAMPEEEADAEAGGTLKCSKCGDNCWAVGWFLQAEDASEERKSLCDNCFLVAPNIKGADRCLLGQVKVIPKKEKKGPKKKAQKVKH